MTETATKPDPSTAQDVGLIPVDEIFGPTIQGEGPLAGTPTMFVRVGGCDYRCAWCDSLHAVLSEHRSEWERLTHVEIADRLMALCEPAQGQWVTLSGGNPAIPPAMPLLVAFLQDLGYRVAMETQGSVVRDWFGMVDQMVISPKPPSAGVQTDWPKLTECVLYAGGGSYETDVALKVVVADDADYAYAKRVWREYGGCGPFFVQPCNRSHQAGMVEPNLSDLRNEASWLMDRVAKDPEAVRWRVIPQLHVWAWGSERGR